MYLETTNQTIYAAEAAIAYPTILLSKTFSKITVEAKADNTKNVVEMEPWRWASPEYSFQDVTQKKITKVEIDPSKTLADINQIDNSFTID